MHPLGLIRLKERKPSLACGWEPFIPKLEGEGFSPGAAQHAAFGGQVGSGTLGIAVVLRDGGPQDGLLLY